MNRFFASYSFRFLLYSLVAGGCFSFSYSQEKKESEEGVPAIEKKNSDFGKTFEKKETSPLGFDQKNSFLDKKFEVKESNLIKPNSSFDKKFETQDADFKKSFSFENKSFPPKSAELTQKTTLTEKTTDLNDRKASDLNDKTFEAKAYEGRETPQAQKEIRELLKQKSGNSKEGDRPLTIDEIKQIVNRDGRIISDEKKTSSEKKE